MLIRHEILSTIEQSFIVIVVIAVKLVIIVIFVAVGIVLNMLLLLLLLLMMLLSHISGFLMTRICYVYLDDRQNQHVITMNIRQQ